MANVKISELNELTEKALDDYLPIVDTSADETKKIATQTLLDMIYPVGSIYMSVNSVNPSTLFGGTWETWGTGRVPVGVDTTQTEFDTVEKTGGSKKLQEHTHTINAIPVSTYNSNNYSDGTNNAWVQYTDGFRSTNSAGTGNSGNLQPYITCYMWKRTA